MEEIIAVFEMQMNLCILRLKMCVVVFTCVFRFVCDCVCVSSLHTITTLFSVLVSPSLLLFVLPQVMKETDTKVKWPSKLKIGAKSKKGDKLFIFQSHQI